VSNKIQKPLNSKAIEGIANMDHKNEPVHALTPDECWSFLATNSLGRIVTQVADVIDIVPVNYYSDGSSILFRTAPGNKLVKLTINNHVVFEVDSVDGMKGWSVIVRGTAKVLELHAEIEVAEESPLQPLVPTPKNVYVRITPDEITGMSFVPGPDPVQMPEPS
jgi:nitroimidazol reductase NimA-like FMN-containing flavoprotein (pyridoxamine 5'-phosphate oxidase superfamily)